jgi:hypothetical protein
MSSMGDSTDVSFLSSVSNLHISSTIGSDTVSVNGSGSGVAIFSGSVVFGKLQISSLGSGDSACNTGDLEI